MNCVGSTGELKRGAMADADKITVYQIRRCRWALRWFFRAQRHSSPYCLKHVRAAIEHSLHAPLHRRVVSRVYISYFVSNGNTRFTSEINSLISRQLFLFLGVRTRLRFD